MNQVFGDVYASAYDSLYAGKDYRRECDLIERQISSLIGNGSWRLLDLGCGTGGHLIPLSERGHRVVGVDRSPVMVANAREKAGRAGSSPEIFESDLRNLNLGETFDAAIMMFAVLGYQITNQDALNALSSVRRHLQPGGAFLFDVWYGPAVVEQKPEQRFRSIPSPSGEILRLVNSKLDSLNQLCRVDYELWVIKGDRVTARDCERHDMRYFFPLELDLLLGQAGFRLVRLGQFDAPDLPPDPTSWNVFCLAQAV